MPRPRIRFGEGDVYHVRVELDGLLPVVWRRVEVSGRASLLELYGVVQCAFERSGDAGYRFGVDGVEYLDPVDEPVPGRAAANAALESLGLYAGARFTHTVELGDGSWHYTVTVEQVVPRRAGQRLPACTGGRRAAPPEECRGPVEYAAFLAASQHPFDARAAELRAWLPDDFDPEFVDLVAINATLSRMPKHRPAA